MITKLMPSSPENIAQAAATLKNGGLVAFPTETVYGLGANALDVDAVKRIFTAKGRPAADPLIVHLSGLSQLARAAVSISPVALKLAETFWPGPLTLILPKQSQIPYLVTAGLETVAVRVPDHPVALALLLSAELLIAAPSANRFGYTSPTSAQHVWDDLNGRIEIILDDGNTPVGVESTVVDVSTNPIRILRPGGITREMLEDVIGPVVVLSQQRDAEKGLPSPGLLAKHYAPQAKMILFRGRNAPQTLAIHLMAARSAGQKVGVLALDGNEADALEMAGAVVCRLGTDLSSVARHVYAGMRLLDSQGVDLILCRDFGVNGLGLAIHDRLTRAAARVVNEE